MQTGFADRVAIRKATVEDIPALLALFCEARATIAALGIDQWQNNYPSREVVAGDIAKGECYLVAEGEELLATFVLLGAPEPTYETVVGGEWLTQTADAYTAVHRFAIAVKARGQGLAPLMLEYAANHARQKGQLSLRIDTHHGNAVMRRMLEKNGFSSVGTIYLANGDPRIAYEKTV